MNHLERIRQLFEPPDRDDGQCLRDATRELEERYDCTVSPISWPLARAIIVHLPTRHLHTAKNVLLLMLFGLIAYNGYCGLAHGHAHEVIFAVALSLLVIFNHVLNKLLIAPHNAKRLTKLLGIAAALILTGLEMGTALLLPEAKTSLLEVIHAAQTGWASFADLTWHKLFLVLLELFLPLVYTVLEIVESAFEHGWRTQVKLAQAHEFAPENTRIAVLFNRTYRQRLTKTLYGLGAVAIVGFVWWLFTR